MSFSNAQEKLSKRSRNLSLKKAGKSLVKDYAALFVASLAVSAAAALLGGTRTIMGSKEFATIAGVIIVGRAAMAATEPDIGDGDDDDVVIVEAFTPTEADIKAAEESEGFDKERLEKWRMENSEKKAD